MARYIHPRFGECRSSSPQSVPRAFGELAEYNARVSRGILHDRTYRKRMKQLQKQFDEWSKEIWPQNGVDQSHG